MIKAVFKFSQEHLQPDTRGEKFIKTSGFISHILRSDEPLLPNLATTKMVLMVAIMQCQKQG